MSVNTLDSRAVTDSQSEGLLLGLPITHIRIALRIGPDAEPTRAREAST